MLLVIICLVFVGCLLIVCPLLAGRLLIRWVEQKIADEKAELSTQLRAFVESPSEDTPSPLALMADQFALLFAGRLWQHMEARLRGSNSQTTASLNKEEEAVLAASNPGMALLGAFLPKKIKKMLEKNPMMVGALSNMMGAAPPGGGDHGSAGNVARKNRD